FVQSAAAPPDLPSLPTRRSSDLSRRRSSGRTDPARPTAGRVHGLPDPGSQTRQSRRRFPFADAGVAGRIMFANGVMLVGIVLLRSEEHTSELQSRFDLVCRLLLE